MSQSQIINWVTKKTTCDSHVSSLTKNVQTIVNYQSDLALVIRPLSNEYIDFLISIKIPQIKEKETKDKFFPIRLYGKNKDEPRSFLSSWYENRWWLTYSISADKMYCFPCFIFFKQSTHSKQIANSKEFGINGSVNWKNGTFTLNNHETKQVHIESCYLYNNYQKTNINSLISDNYCLAEKKKREQIEKNRQILHRLIDIVLLCAQNNIAFRGADKKNAEKEKKGIGCFKEIVHHTAKYDAVLKDHLENGNKNSLYLHGSVINEFLDLISAHILDKIREKQQKSKYFSIMCDETKDICNIEQASICIRFIDQETKRVDERFIGFESLEFANAEGITNAILNRLEKVGLDLKSCRAQTYDGASVMSGHKNGVQMKIKEQQPKAVFFHCFSHILDLCMHINKENVFIAECLGNFYPNKKLKTHKISSKTH